MKQLDEMERMARGVVDAADADIRFADETGNAHHVFNDEMLARAFLAVMPVVRAAEAWLKQPGIDWQRTQGSAFGRANHELANAIDEMRRRLGGE